MSTTIIRKKLTEYLKTADDKKVKAIYALVEDEIELAALDYSNELKNELNERYADYKKGTKMIPASAANKLIKKVLES